VIEAFIAFFIAVAYLGLGFIVAFLIFLHDRYHTNATFYSYRWDMSDILFHAIIWPLSALLYLLWFYYQVLNNWWNKFIKELDNLIDKETKGDL
jgi:hypothetical protein